ncbi:beta-propeller fold lactonase family protein [Amedibacillus sp. YH-ame10]
MIQQKKVVACMKNIHGFIGTYSDKGIYEFSFDTSSGKFVHHDLYLQVKEAKYVSYDYETLAFPCNLDKPCVMTNKKNLMHCNGTETHVACYITQDEHYIYTANYHDGIVVRYHKGTNEITLDKVIFIQEKAGTHQVLLTQDEVIVPNCLLDNILVYERTSLELKRSIEFKEGTGPRHGVLSQDEGTLYLLSELSCEVFSINLKDHDRIVKSLCMLDKEQHASAAAIRMSQDERFLYVSLREINKLCVIDIVKWSVVQSVDCGGDHPRDMNISKDDAYVFCVNRNTNDVTAFHRNTVSGILTFVDRLGDIPEGVAIVFESGGKEHAKK